MTEMTDAEELVGLVCDAIRASDKLVGLDWESISIVFDLGVGSVSNSGFAYLTDKVIPVAATGSLVGDYVRALRDALKQPDQPGFAEMLVQIRRRDGCLHVDFEYDNPKRWRIGPANFVQMREALRPVFPDQ